MNKEELEQLFATQFANFFEMLKGYFVTKQEFNSTLYEFRKENNDRFNDVNQRLDEISESIEELKPSARVLDFLLEHHPIERIERLETCIGLPVFVSLSQED